MLTDDQDRTAVYPTQAGTDHTEPMHPTEPGRNSPVVRAEIVVAIVMLLIGAGIVVAMLLPDRAATDTVSSTNPIESVEATDETEPATGRAEPTTAPDSTGAAEPAADGNAFDTSLSGVDVPADLAGVVSRIEASIQRLEPSIGAVHVSQDVLDFLRSQQPIDTEAVIVDACTDTYCWVWLHGDALESRVSVTRDGGAMLLIAVG